MYPTKAIRNELGNRQLPNLRERIFLMTKDGKGLQMLPNIQMKPDELNFCKSIYDLIQQARHTLGRSINTTMTMTYFEIGRRIIEKEQQGEKRAQYGKRILKDLSDYLTANLGKGFSVENLKLMRRFYSVYSKNTIGQSTITQFVRKDTSYD